MILRRKEAVPKLDPDVFDDIGEGRTWYAVLQLAIPGAEDHKLPLRIADPHCLLKPGDKWDNIGPFGEITAWKLTIYGGVQPPECANPRRVLIEEGHEPNTAIYTGITKKVRGGGTHSIEGPCDAEGIVLTLAELFAPSYVPPPDT